MMLPNGLIAVSGATGGLGRRVAERLSVAGVDLRLVVRDAGRSRFLPGSEVVENPGGYADGDGLAAAARAGVQRVISRRTTLPPHDSRACRGPLKDGRGPRRLRDGVDGAADSLHADFVPALAVPAGGPAVIAGPAGSGAASSVSRDDCADAAVLLDGSAAWDGRTLEVTGPQALSLAEAAAAAVLTEVSGVPIGYREETVEEAWASRRPSGHPDWEIEGWITSYTSIAADEMSAVTDVVPSLTGHPARTLAEQLRAHPGDRAHLRQA